MTPETAAKKHWDVIIIGTGMGGGMVGRRLAEAGLSVLFVEKGPQGHRREEQYIDVEMTDPVARTIWAAWPKPAEVKIDGRTSRFYIPIGAGVGGSSVFYAGTLERPELHDLESRPGRPHPTGGWPVGYDRFLPYFDLAENWLKICGEPDPLSELEAPTLLPPPPLPEGETALMERFRKRGLHPYRLHSALRYLEGCQGCPGYKCPRNCKMDGRSAGVEPARASGQASLLYNCEVTEILEKDEGRVTGLAVRQGGQEFELHAKVYVLAAGALSSPRLLLASKARNAEGCANSSGWVGHGLMFHLNEFFAIWPRRGAGFSGATKSISMRDFYFRKGQRLGVVQSLGVEASYGDIVQYLNKVFDRSFLRGFRKLRRLTNLPAYVAAKILGGGKTFVALLEDLPYHENRVFLIEEDPDIIGIDYIISRELRVRRTLFRKLIRHEMGGWKTLFFGLHPELNFGHPSGTLRFGLDPGRSVLDPDCKAHDLENLYVADASFMPTSMGINPSLTIAANALRVADIIVESLKKDGHEHD